MASVNLSANVSTLIVFNSFDCYDEYPSGIHMFYYQPDRASKIVQDFMSNFLELIDGMIINGNTWATDLITDEDEFMAINETTTHKEIPVTEQFVCDLSSYCSALISYLRNNDQANYAPISEDHMVAGVPNQFNFDWTIDFCRTFLVSRVTGLSQLPSELKISRIVYCGFIP